MHFVYFSENKLERFYDFLVERTEEQTKKVILKEGSGKVGVKGKGTLGSILAHLGLASLEVEAEVSASGKIAFSKEVVSRFTPTQKLKALLFKLDSEDRLADLNAFIKTDKLPKENTPIVYTVGLQTDLSKQPEPDILKTEAVILTGHIDNFEVKIQASLEFMESKNAWRRFQLKPRYIAGFGTLIGSDMRDQFTEIDPIVFGYAMEHLPVI